jgi:hypothetical protein
MDPKLTRGKASRFGKRVLKKGFSALKKLLGKPKFP